MPAAIVAVDAGLASAPRLSGVVAVAQAAVMMVGAALFGHAGQAPPTGPMPVPLLNRAGLLNVLGDALLPWLVGRYTTARRAYIAELEKRSEREQAEARQAMAAAIARRAQQHRP